MQDGQIQNELWTVEDVAAFLKMKRSAVYSLTRERGKVRSEIRLPCFKIHSKALRFRKSDVLDWIDQCAEAARGARATSEGAEREGFESALKRSFNNMQSNGRRFK